MRKRNILAIIPARKGSKRLKNKNELILDGKPLFLWTLELAIKSNLFNDIYVSTDSKKIFEISKKKNCLCPGLRKARLAKDNVTLIEVTKDIIQEYEEKNKKKINAVVLLQPTSPFRSIETIKKGINLFFQNKKRESIIAVSYVKSNPKWCFKMKGNIMRPYLKQHGYNLQSQKLKKVIAPNGSLFISSPDCLKLRNSFFSKNPKFIFNKYRYEELDIDDQNDLNYAKAISKYGIKNFKVGKN